jgi:hypothetical protein
MADKEKTQSNSFTNQTNLQSEFRFKIWDRSLATISALSLIIGGVWGLWQYIDQQEKDRELRDQEYNLALYKERKEMYYALCAAVGEIASSKSSAEAEPAIKAFFKLYHGGVHIVSDRVLDEAKAAFARKVVDLMSGPKDQAPPPELVHLADNLVEKCKESLDLEKVYGRTKEAGKQSKSN